MKMRSQVGTLVACLVALSLPLLYPLLTGRVFVGDDLVSFHLPMRFLYQQALQNGDSFLWSPALYGGMYIHGEGQAGMAHPFHLLIYRLLPLNVALNAEILGAYAFALLGMRLFLKRLGVSIEGAWFGAMLFAFSGFSLMHMVHLNAIQVVAHLPWLLVSLHALFTSGDRRGRALAFASVALLIASQLLLGYPQYVWMTMFAAGCFTIYLLIDGAAWGRLWSLAFAVLIGAVMGGIQILPTLDALQHSMRDAPTADFRQTFSLPPINLLQLLSPYVFKYRVNAVIEERIAHELSVYNGSFCTVAIIWLAVRWRSLEKRRMVIGFVALAAVSLLLSLGRYGGVYGWLSALPGLSSFRAPARHIVLFQFALAGLGAMVFEDILTMIRRGEKLRSRQYWPFAVLIAISVAITIVSGSLEGSAWASTHDLAFARFLRSVPWAIVFCVTILLTVLAGAGRRWAVPALIVVVAADLGAWGYLYQYQSWPERLDVIANRAPVPPSFEKGDLVMAPLGASPRNTVVLRGLRVYFAYVALQPASTLPLLDQLSHRIAGVTWANMKSTDGWVRVENPMPRARLVSESRVGRGIEAARTIDIAKVGLVDAALEGLSGLPGTVEMVTDRPGEITVRTHAPGRQLLILTERFHEGWRASDATCDHSAIRVYGDLLGCVVESGDREITFRFAPSSAQAGLQMTLAGVGLCLAFSALTSWFPRARFVDARRVAPEMS